MKFNNLLSVSAVIAMSLSVTSVSAQENIRWKVPNAFPSHLPAIGENAGIAAEILDQVSGGRIQFKIFEPGNLVPPLELTDAVQNGSIEAGYTWLGYDAGKIPASQLFAAVPFGLEPWEYTSWWYEGGGKELGEEVYGARNVHPILCGINGPETAGWFRNEITSIDQFQGLKIRFAGLGGQVMQELGASVTLLPGSEIFQALEKGALDATEFSMPAVDELLGFDKVAKFNYFPGWHQPFTAFHLVIQKQRWDEFDDQTKAMFDTACTATTLRSLARGEAIQGKVIRGFAEKGVQAGRYTPEMLEKLAEVSQQVLQAQSASDAEFAKVYESQQAFAEDYETWKSLAYLPRGNE